MKIPILLYDKFSLNLKLEPYHGDHELTLIIKAMNIHNHSEQKSVTVHKIKGDFCCKSRGKEFHLHYIAI